MSKDINSITELVALLLPVIGLFGSFLAGQKQAAKFIIFGHLTAFLFAIATLGGALVEPANRSPIIGQGFLQWHIDIVSCCLLVGITFIAAVIVTFSERYLGGDESRLKFLRSVSFLSFCAATLAITDNTFVAFVCWNMLSLGLWQTMRLQESGRISASVVLKHHVLSDTAMLAALILVFSSTGLTAFSQLPDALKSLDHPVNICGHALPLSTGSMACSLLVLAFSIKSALFPFHRWLLATLDAPTPLSGLLHAGVVNVSAILAWRMMPMLQGHESVLLIWGTLAALSAVVGTLSMSAQPDVKRKLVYSTVGQMGFMSLQCASGAIAAALFHLLAHGLFKSHMFLQSGSAVAEGLNKKKYGGAGQITVAEQGTTKNKIAIMVGAFAFSAALYAVCKDYSLSGISTAIAAAAVFCAVPTVPKVNFQSLSVFWMSILALSLVAGFACTGLEQSVEFHSSVNNWLLPLCLGVFAIISLVLRMARRTRMAKALYVHSLNGFYIDEISAGSRSAARLSL
ncbi:MAG TPA: proton-conducting transporter membrane subunit [Drouetiella sp.]|jgi:NADH:ubiquinone oxidoreductase subunit 5 (subunit L)/multisubunit Na+/H+ antiporter MnhA subunit